MISKVASRYPFLDIKIRNYVSSEKKQENKKVYYITEEIQFDFCFVLFIFFFSFSFWKKKYIKKKGTIGIGLDLDQAYSTTKKE